MVCASTLGTAQEMLLRVQKAASPSVRLVAFFSASVNPSIVVPELVWQCEDDIFSIYCHWNVKLHFNQLLLCFLDTTLLLLITFF
jgi:hypothetical protein